MAYSADDSGQALQQKLHKQLTFLLIDKEDFIKFNQDIQKAIDQAKGFIGEGYTYLDHKLGDFYCAIEDRKNAESCYRQIMQKKNHLGVFRLIDLYNQHEEDPPMEICNQFFYLINRIFQKSEVTTTSIKTWLAGNKEKGIPEILLAWKYALEMGEIHKFRSRCAEVSLNAPMKDIFDKKTEYLQIPSLLELAIKKGIAPKNLFRLGVYLEERENYTEAAKFYLIAANAGQDYAENQLALLYHNNKILLESEYKEFIIAFYNNNKTIALYSFGHTLELAENFEEAAEWYRKEINAGKNTFVMWLVSLLINQHMPMSEEDKTLFKNQAETGNFLIMLYLGTLLENQKKFKEAEQWYKKAIEAGKGIVIGENGVDTVASVAEEQLIKLQKERKQRDKNIVSTVPKITPEEQKKLQDELLDEEDKISSRSVKKSNKKLTKPKASSSIQIIPYPKNDPNEARKLEELRRNAQKEAHKAEKARKAEEARKAEVARLAAIEKEAVRRAAEQEAHKAEKARKAEEDAARIAAEIELARIVEQARLVVEIEEARKTEEARKAREENRITFLLQKASLLMNGSPSEQEEALNQFLEISNDGLTPLHAKANLFAAQLLVNKNDKNSTNKALKLLAIAEILGDSKVSRFASYAIGMILKNQLLSDTSLIFPPVKHSHEQMIFTYFNKAAGLGHHKSMYEIGLMLKNGYNDETSGNRLDKALAFFSRAMQLNHLPSAYEAASIIRSGTPTQVPNAQLADQIIVKSKIISMYQPIQKMIGATISAPIEFSNAAYTAGLIYAGLHWPNFPNAYDDDKAFRAFQLGAQLGHEDSQFEYALRLFSGTPAQQNEAEFLLTKLGKVGHHTAPYLKSLKEKMQAIRQR